MARFVNCKTFSSVHGERSHRKRGKEEQRGGGWVNINPDCEQKQNNMRVLEQGPESDP